MWMGGLMDDPSSSALRLTTPRQVRLLPHSAGFAANKPVYVLTSFELRRGKLDEWGVNILHNFRSSSRG